jgi:hypothetical protein
VLLAGGACGVASLTDTSSSAHTPSASGPLDGTDGSSAPLSTATPSSAASASPSPFTSASAGPRASAKPSSAGTSGCTIAGGTAGYPAAPPVAPASGKKWKLSFSEEFTGNDYDHSTLTPCFDWNNGDCMSSFNHGREHYMPSQVKVSNGTAKLIVAPLSPANSSSACENGKCTYKGGLLSTARPNASNGSGYLYRFTYGYVETRIKFPATMGFFTAFWMLPADPSYNYQTEIDILELLGDDPTTIFMTYHYAGRDQSYPVNSGRFHNGACATKDYSKNFVRMGASSRSTTSASTSRCRGKPNQVRAITAAAAVRSPPRWIWLSPNRSRHLCSRSAQ